MFTVQKIFACFAFLLLAATAHPAFAVLPAEKPVVQKLHDVRALLNSGVSFATYSKHLDELIILNDRLKRSQRKETALQSVVARMVEGRDLWADQLNSTGAVAASMEKRVQINFEIAYMLLDGYENPAKK